MRPQRAPWTWVSCTDYHCGHSRAVPLVPWAIRWAAPEPLDLIRCNFTCSACGRRGAILHDPGIEHGTGLPSPYPVGHHIRIGHHRRMGESCLAAEARGLAEYLARYPNGDALAAFRGGAGGIRGMCGKFTAMASWADVVAFSSPLDGGSGGDGSGPPGPGDNDREVTFRVMSNLPVIVWDRQAGKRRVVPMRWGFPHPRDWRRPQPIHARAETIDTTKAFAEAFLDGQRGIVLVKTFNEAPDIEGPTVQHTITPGAEPAIGIAFLWRRFELPDLPLPLLACVMVTVPANALIAALPTDRMPAVLADEDWATWLGETDASPDQAKAVLKTVEGINWRMSPEQRAKKPRQKPTRRDPGGLL